MKIILLALLLLTGPAFAQSVPGSGALVPLEVSVSAGASGSRTMFSSLLLGPSTWNPAEIKMVGDQVSTAVNAAMRPGVVVKVAGVVPKATIVAALGRFALKNMPLLNTGIAFYDLANELGFHVSANGGPPVVEKSSTYPDGSVDYSGNDPGGIGTQAGACQSAYGGACGVRAYGVTAPSGYTYCNGSQNYGPGVCTELRAIARSDSQPGYYLWSSYWRANAVLQAGFVASSVQALTDAIAAKSGWPSSSALPRAVADAAQSGEVMASPTQSVTGPSSSPAGSSVTTDPINNTTNTTTTTNNYTYAGDTVTTNQTTTNSTVNNSTGAVTTNTTTTTNPDPVDPCEASPGRVGCMKSGDVPDTPELPRTDTPVTFANVAFAAPSGCPAAIPFSMFGHTYAMPYTDLCNMLGPIRLIFLAFGAALAATIFMEGLKS